MARNVFFLEDRGVHEVVRPTFTGVCGLALYPIEPGPYLVLAKGDFEPAYNTDYNASFEIRLEVLGPGERHGDVHVLHTTLGTDQTKFILGRPNDSGPRTFSLMVQATIPHKALAAEKLDEVEYSPAPRVVVSARGAMFQDSRGQLSNIRICAIPAEDIVVTTLP